MEDSFIFLERHSLAQLKGMVQSNLRGENRRRSTIDEIVGFKRRVQEYGINHALIDNSIIVAIDSSPNCNTEKAQALRRTLL